MQNSAAPVKLAMAIALIIDPTIPLAFAPTNAAKAATNQSNHQASSTAGALLAALEFRSMWRADGSAPRHASNKLHIGWMKNPNGTKHQATADPAVHRDSVAPSVDMLPTTRCSHTQNATIVTTTTPSKTRTRAVPI